MELTGAQVLVDSLKSAGVEVIFGVSASDLLGTLDVLYRTPEIRYIQTQHEQAAMYMANGYAGQARRLGVCLVSPGPGATNCMSGVAQAHYTSTPTLVIGAEENSSVLGLGATIHHDLDTLRIFAPVTKLATVVGRKDRLQESLQRAITTAMADRKGPCYLGIPNDILHETVNVDAPGLSLHGVGPSRGNPQDIEAVAGLLQQARRPLLLAGGGVNWAGAHAEVMQLAEFLGMPVVATTGHNGIFPEDHPLGVGSLGSGCPPFVWKSFYEADLILGIGCAFAYLVGGGQNQPLPKNAKIVHIDVDPTEIGKLLPVEGAVVGDAKLVIQDLLVALKDRGVVDRQSHESSEWTQMLARRKTEWAHFLQPLQASDQIPIQNYRLMGDLRKALPRNAVVAAESGGTRGWFQRAFQATAPSNIGGWHPLGAEFCEAMGAKVAAPETPVVVIMGDGSMMMTLQEWASAVANDIPVLCVVLHNGVFGNMRAVQIKQFQGRSIGTELPIPNLTTIVREFGAHAERVEEPAQIIPAVHRALASGKPALLEVMVDTSAQNLAPPKLPS